MKSIKIVGIVILVIIAGFFVGAFFLPQKVQITSTETVNVPINEVFALVNDFNNWSEWSPWFDTSKVYTYIGSEYGVGSIMRWVDSKGQVGEREIVESVENKKIVVITQFRAEHSKAIMDFSFHELDSGKTEVVLSFDMKNQFSYPFGRYIAWMIQAGVDVSFPKALTNIKDVAEK